MTHRTHARAILEDCQRFAREIADFPASFNTDEASIMRSALISVRQTMDYFTELHQSMTDEDRKKLADMRRK